MLLQSVTDCLILSPPVMTFVICSLFCFVKNKMDPEEQTDQGS